MANGPETELFFEARRQELRRNRSGNHEWVNVAVERRIDPRASALILCDVWDDHWCRAAVDRLESLVPRMREVVDSARDRGLLIIHAPSETMDFYRDNPARLRAVDAPHFDPPAEVQHEDPPLPIDDEDGGCDTKDNPYPTNQRRWKRQHASIPIDDRLDAITDDGREVYRLLGGQERRHLFIMGVHTNMCILNRSFAIKQMVRWGVDVYLLRDMTDSMYNPASAPYVSHDEGTHLVIDYIEKFWCPTVSSRTLCP